MGWRLICSAVLITMGMSSANGQVAPKHLPIDLPPEARVNFEVDSPASELFPFLGMLLSNSTDLMSSLAAKQIPISTPFGTIQVATKDLVTLLKPVRELHMVTFRSPSGLSAIDHYDREFTKLGMKRLVKVDGSNALLIMKDLKRPDQYLIVSESERTTAVVRSDGVPKLGMLGELLLEKITESARRYDHS